MTITAIPTSQQPSSRGFVTPTGHPVKRSIPTAAVARAVIQELELSEEPAARRHARYRALVDRNPPFSQDKLDALNLGSITNLDFGEAQAAVRKKAGQHFELFQEVPTLAEFELVDLATAEAAANQPRPRSEDIVGEEFTRTLKEWSGFLPLMDFLRREADTVDVGVCAWRDPYDWRPVPVSRGAFFPSPYARVDVATWDLVMLADVYTAHQLLATASDEEAAKEEGWDVARIRAVLVDVFVGGLAQDTGAGVESGYPDVSRWEQLQLRIRNNDPACLSRMFSQVKVRHLFVKEPQSGKVSHLILPTIQSGTEDDGFLCTRYDAYDNMAQAVFVLPFDYGNGYIRSVRGLIASIEAHCDLSNRYLGRLMDAGFLSGTLMLKNLGEYGDPRKLQITRAGLVTLLPKGAEALQASSYAPPLNNMVQVRALSAAVMQNNNGVDRVNPEIWAENQPQKTAREVSEISTKEARLEKSNVAFDYAMLQLLYREMYRRMIGEVLTKDDSLPGAKEARAFIDRCVRRGVPRAWLKPGKLRLCITTSIGWGSLGVRLDVTNQIMGMRGMFDEVGRTNAVRDRVAALVGYRNVDRYMAGATRDSIPSNEASLARLENNDAIEGAQIDVGADQNHVLHIRVHAEPVKMIVDAVANGDQVDPMKALPPLEQLIPHLTTHLQYTAQDPARGEFVTQTEDFIKAAVEVRDKLAAEADKIAKAQQEEQRAQQEQLARAQEIINGQDLNLKAQQAQGKLQIESEKNASIMQMRASRQAHGEMMAERNLNAQISLKEREQAANIELKRRNAELEAEIKRLKAQSGG